MVPDDTAQQQQEYTPANIGPITWWSWRPGIKPRIALLIGELITFLGLLLTSIGLIALISGILDSFSPPLQLSGIVTGHTMNNIDGLPRLTIRLHTAGFPASVSPVVSGATFHAIHDGDHILVDYSPHLHFLYALDHAGMHYTFPGSSASDDPLGSTALLLLGIILLPYPALLTLWGWRDLLAEHGGHAGRCKMTARIVGLRTTVQTRTTRPHRPGLTPRLSPSWYGVALLPVDSISSQQLMTFGISDEMYRSLHEGDLVHITYSPHLHYVYALEARMQQGS